MHIEMSGAIAGVGFVSGHRVVVGHWQETPIGGFTDVMLADPDGRRTLLAPDDRAARFVVAVYRFESIVVEPIDALWQPPSLTVRSATLRLDLTTRRPITVPFRRPAWFTRLVEGPISGAVTGARTYGRSPTGIREWYRADAVHPIAAARAAVHGVDLGGFGPPRPATRFGFAEPPARPAVVDVRPLLVDSSGRLADLWSLV